MYNGIGLRTARGSGTSGHVQKNLSLVKPRRNYGRENEIGGASLNGSQYYSQKFPKKSDLMFHSESRMELLEHGKLRKLEIELLEYSEYLEEKGITGSEFDERIESKKKELLLISGKGNSEGVQKCCQREMENTNDEGNVENEFEKEERLRMFREAIGLDNPIKKRQRYQQNRKRENVEQGMKKTNFNLNKRYYEESVVFNDTGGENYGTDSYHNKYNLDKVDQRKTTSNYNRDNHIKYNSQSSIYKQDADHDLVLTRRYENINTAKGRDEQYPSSSRNLRILDFKKKCSGSRRPRRSRSPSTISRYHSLSRSLSP
ncbi:shares a domain with the CWFL SRm300 family RNA binding s [Cryptosporidium bovis]|uniref:shares a domain with the CWFL SRm300 family RNA binding s n=1 Tax=Cryptosporidium bovis TaxID=310047 RepID=UPI003519F3CE|nr:shares a domain with the CWFL SRm300 family RNA binding s [Cryptosporidium bovis]